MSLSATTVRCFRVLTVAAVLGLGACAPTSETGNGTGGAVAGTGGATSGSGGATAGSGGAVGSGGAGTGGAGTGGAAVVDSGGPDLMSIPDGPAADGATGWGGVPGIEDFSIVKQSQGCGMPPGVALGDWVMQTVTITPKPVRGTGNRIYWIKLPANYDNKKVYKTIFMGPGCGGTGRGMYDFTTAAGAEGVIQIGLNPEPGVWQGSCFDDKRTDSIEYKFFETVLDIADKKLCFDRHRVFFAGHSSGSWVSNQFGCVYGMKLLRAVAPSSGGLAEGAGVAPPCTDLPTPGIWHHNEDDTGNPPIGSEVAINRALKVNKCTGTFATSPRGPWMDEPVCEQFTSCPKEFPIVYCHPKTGGHVGNLGPQPAKTWKFIQALP